MSFRYQWHKSLKFIFLLIFFVWALFLSPLHKCPSHFPLLFLFSFPCKYIFPLSFSWQIYIIITNWLKWNHWNVDDWNDLKYEKTERKPKSRINKVEGNDGNAANGWKQNDRNWCWFDRNIINIIFFSKLFWWTLL